MDNLSGIGRTLPTNYIWTEWRDQVLFFAVALLGSSAIVVFRGALDMPWWATCLPVALMILYVLYVTLSGRFMLERDRAGDNVYYLGLTFTLVALAVSLYRFTVSDNLRADIVTNFGIALITTIIGVVFRVALLQLRGDPADAQQRARLTLVEAAVQLATEVQSTVESLGTLRLAINQSIQETSKEAREAIDQLMRGHASTFSERLDQAAVAIQQSSRDMATSLAAMSERVIQVAEKSSEVANQSLAESRAHSQAIAQTTKRLSAAVEKLIERVDGIAAPTDLLERKLTPSIAELEGTIKMFASSIRQTEALTRDSVGLMEGSTVMMAELHKHMEKLKALDVGSSSLGASASAMETSIRTLRSNADELAAAVRQVTPLLEGEILAMRQHSAALEHAAREAKEATGMTVRTLTSLAKTVVEQLNGER